MLSRKRIEAKRTYKAVSKIAWRNPGGLPGGSGSGAETQGSKAGDRWGSEGSSKVREMGWVHSRTSTKAGVLGALEMGKRVTEGGQR